MLRQLLYHYSEFTLRLDEKSRFLKEARQSIDDPDSKEGRKIMKSYKRDLNRYMFTFDEWNNLYCCNGKSEDYKREFISRSEAQKWYRKLNKPSVRMDFMNKSRFISIMGKEGISRRTLVCDIAKETEIMEFLRKGDTIAKPVEGTLGRGIFKIKRLTSDSSISDEIMNKLQGRGYILEECIQGHDSIQRFHPESLNTIRVMTGYDGDNVEMFGCFIRFGRGESVVDNAHAGGIFCTVDIDSGTIVTDGHDTFGHIYQWHPDSKIRFNGFRIPEWDAIVRKCLQAHRKFDLPFVGWDICLTKQDNVEFIEGNHGPDVDIIQGPTKTGCRTRFERICNGYKSKKNEY